MSDIALLQPRQYDKTSGEKWALTPTSRIVLLDGPAVSWERLAACVNTLGEEYPVLGATAQLRDMSPMAGDLVLRSGCPEELEGRETFQEGYVIRIGETVELTAQSERAAFYGLRTICELLAGEGGLTRGVIVDYPDTQERGLHLDTGRKFFTKEWILELVRDLSRNRMNTLWLHFSENEGFRFACDSHPEAPSLFHLSKEDVREILRFARTRYIDVNPALDSPGHLGQALREHPRWQLMNREGGRLYSALDVTSLEARQFVKELLDEYMDLFAGSKVFHIGGDEFIDFRDFSAYPAMESWAKAYLGPQYGSVDTYIDYLNDIAAYVRTRGFQVRVWNDGLCRADVEQRLELDRDVQIAYWTNWDKGMAPLQTFLDQGYQVINYHGGYLYYILLQRRDYQDPEAEKILREWNPNQFPESPVCGAQAVPEEQAGQLLGSCYSIWCDWPDLQSEQEVRSRSQDSLRAFAQRCWRWKQ